MPQQVSNAKLRILPTEVCRMLREQFAEPEQRRHLGEVFRRLAQLKKCRIEEEDLQADRVDMMISIPPKNRCRQ